MVRATIYGCLLAFLLGFSFGKQALATDLNGSWKGYWKSTTSGHQGPLKAEFCRLANDRYRVRFSGRFFVVVPFRYTVTLRVVHDDGQTVTLRGSSYLGRLYGTFTYRATSDGCQFEARYDSCRDDGKFVLCKR